jgi:hypothetical protein
LGVKVRADIVPIGFSLKPVKDIEEGIKASDFFVQKLGTNGSPALANEYDSELHMGVFTCIG